MSSPILKKSFIKSNKPDWGLGSGVSLGSGLRIVPSSFSVGSSIGFWVSSNEGADSFVGEMVGSSDGSFGSSTSSSTDSFVSDGYIISGVLVGSIVGSGVIDGSTGGSEGSTGGSEGSTGGSEGSVVGSIVQVIVGTVFSFIMPFSNNSSIFLPPFVLTILLFVLFKF